MSNDLAPMPDGFRPLHVQGAFGALTGPFFFRREADGDFRYGFRAEARHANPNGIVHGGALYTFADQFMGRLVVAATKRNCATVSLNVDYLAPGRIDAWVEGRGRVIRATRSLAFVEAEVWQAERALMTASGVWRLQQSLAG